MNAAPSEPLFERWRRLNAALMPDYNRKAAAFWWLMVSAGGLALALCLLWLLRQPWHTALQIGIGLLLAVGSGLFPVRVPGTRHSFAAGEISIFLVLLMLGPMAAAIVAAGEVAIGAWRTSRRWSSRLVSPAISLLSIGSTGLLLHAALPRLDRAGLGGAAALSATMMVFAGLYFVLNAVLVSGVQRLKQGEPFFQLLDALSVFRWIGMAYAGSAAVATLLYVVWREQGPAVLWVMVPLLAMLLLTLHFYFRQQEALESMRAAGEALTEREALMVEREAQVAGRHWQALQASEHRFHSAFTHASIGMALLDFDGRVLQANPALGILVGLPEVQLLTRLIHDFVFEDDRATLDQHLDGARFPSFEGFTQELRFRHTSGSTVWLALNGSSFTDPESARPCLILQAQDVSGRRRAEAGLQHLAFHDSLTGLPNRRRFIECLAGAVSRVKTDARRPWAVMFIDFDRFKHVNDSLGHDAGDELLLQMARRVQENLRPTDIVARLGGDEFAILADHIDDQRHALILAERLMEALRSPFQIGEVELVVSASIGITFSTLGYDSAEAVLRDADTAMYKAKAAGKARYAVFDASLHAAVAERLRLEGELRRAIDQGELTLEYQPIFALGAAADMGGPLLGFEALVRWQHPQNGRLLPAAFLQVAEESGQMLALSDFVLHSACRQLRQWQLADPAHAELTISINLSAQDLALPGLVERVSRALQESGLRPKHLTLELTENILMAPGAKETLSALRALGLKLALDDFGTGYSSLSHLSRLPIDSLKIDGSLVSRLQRDPSDVAVVSAIIQLGGTLHKVVVAEGIESAAQMAQLRELGCGYGQGFHLATPLTAEGAGEWLRGPGGTMPMPLS